VRLVQSKELQEERAAHRPLYGVYGTCAPGNVLRRVLPRFKNAANISVLHWQQRLFALYEPDAPTELAVDDLSTLGATNLDHLIPRAFSAHPHRVSARRAIYNFGVRYGRTPQLDLFELPDVGPARRLGTLPLSGPTMIHDFIATPSYLVFFVPPLRSNVARLLLGVDSFSDSLRWQPSLGTEVMVVPIDDPEAVIRFSVDPFYQWHFANAFERGGEVVVDLVRYPDFRSNEWLRDAPTGRPSGEIDGTLQRAVVDPSHRSIRVEQLWDTTCEFPRTAPAVAGGALPLRLRGGARRPQPARSTRQGRRGDRSGHRGSPGR
jgi:all-trans-8'-apo-beta-carotenal 15,15'-oxygenase